ncbi:MAG: OmpA family protein [Candidatus Polarisedimenticolia bacterium]
MRRRIAPLLAVVLLATVPLFAWGKDADNDGVKDRKDECASTPVGSKVDKSGCHIDTDRDGVPNGVDQCSTTPERWDVDATGCPQDRDRDGVADGQDSCLGSLAGASVDTRGCTSDSDQDGVLDGLDRCASTPYGYRVELHGCPVDTDHDGVNEAQDRCADSRPAETVDSEGCRVKSTFLAQASSEPLQLDGLTFEKNRVEVGTESGAVLQDLASFLRDYPETRVEVGAYTDKAGSASSNLALSSRRAEFVKNYLVGLGVEPAQVEAKGYGEKGNVNQRIIQVRTLSPSSNPGSGSNPSLRSSSN